MSERQEVAWAGVIFHARMQFVLKREMILLHRQLCDFIIEGERSASTFIAGRELVAAPLEALNVCTQIGQVVCLLGLS